MATERVLVLASSRKQGGRCIAGLSLDGNGLIRPVSDHGDGALSSYDTQLSTAPNELDVVSFSHDGYEGDLVQPENVVVDGSAWTNEGPMDAAEALKAHRASSAHGLCRPRQSRQRRARARRKRRHGRVDVPDRTH